MILRKAPLRYLWYLIITDLMVNVTQEQLKLFRSEHPKVDLTNGDKPAYQLESNIEIIAHFMEKNRIGFYEKEQK